MKSSGCFQSFLHLYHQQAVELFLKLYDVEDPKTIIFFMRLYEGLVLQKTSQDAQRERRKREQKTGVGKNYTHNVRG